MGKENAARGGIVGVKIGAVDSIIGRLVGNDEHIQLAIHIEIGHCYITILRDTRRQVNGFQLSNTIQRCIGSACNVNFVNCITTNQFGSWAFHHIGSKRHRNTIWVSRIATPSPSHITSGRACAQSFQRSGIINRIANINFRIAILVEIGQRNSTFTRRVHIRCIQQPTIDIVRAKFVVVAVKNYSALHSATTVRIAHKCHGTAKAGIDSLSLSKRYCGQLTQVCTTEYAHLRREMSISGGRCGLCRHNFHYAITINITHQRHKIGMDIVSGKEQMGIPRLLDNINRAVGRIHIVGEFGNRHINRIQCLATILILTLNIILRSSFWTDRQRFARTDFRAVLVQPCQTVSS